MPVPLKAPKGHQKPTRRRGRGPGSGLGKTSGRGHKGQNARSGGGVRPGFEGGQMPLYRRLPKRGFKSPFKKEYRLVHLSRLASAFEDGATVDREALVKAGLVRHDDGPVKVLRDTDEFGRRLVLVVDAISAPAKDLVEKAGGEVRLARERAKKG